MPRYAHIQDGRIVWEKEYPDVLPEDILTRKNILPIVVTKPVFDRTTHVLVGPVDTIHPDKIDRVFSTKAKTRDELNKTIREARKQAYLDQLGVDAGNFQNTVGDVFDIVIKKIRALEAVNAAAPEAEFDAMVKKIDAIKAANPKP